MGVSVKFLFLIEQRVEAWSENPCIGDVFMEVVSFTSPSFHLHTPLHQDLHNMH